MLKNSQTFFSKNTNHIMWQ